MDTGALDLAVLVQQQQNVLILCFKRFLNTLRKDFNCHPNPNCSFWLCVSAGTELVIEAAQYIGQRQASSSLVAAVNGLNGSTGGSFYVLTGV